MFKLMRNTHLVLGLSFSLIAVVFAVSSIVIIYRPMFPNARQESEATVSVPPGVASTPRALAMHLMREHDLAGDLRGIEESDDTITLNINRPGVHSRVEYSRASGEARIETRQYNVYERLVQLHVNHGFWHDFLPSNIWAVLSLLFSIVLLLLGASGIYLWFRYKRERMIGSVLLGLSLAIGFVSLIWTRIG